MIRQRYLAVTTAAVLAVVGFASSTARAAPLAPSFVTALDLPAADILSADAQGDPLGIANLSAPVLGMPTKSSAVVISTGIASNVLGEVGGFNSTNLSGGGSVDGNDLTSIKLQLKPPKTATCLSFDFVFMSEEFPEFVGTSFNDIFTAELNETLFSKIGNQVVAPNNFAYDTQGKVISINTVLGISERSGTRFDGSTQVLTATTPIEKKIDDTMDLFLTIQDLGDSVYDSGVIVDNLRWSTTVNCSKGVNASTDTDGDQLLDTWETKGIDYNNDGVMDIDLKAMGADPNHKDLFVEADWMEKPKSCVLFFCWGGRSFAPMQSALADVQTSFANSPVTNPDGTTGIRLHIDSGSSSVMDPVTGALWGSRSRSNVVPYANQLGSFSGSNYEWSAFEGIKTSNFEFTRRDVFHYVIYGDKYATSNSSGISRSIPASDFIVTDGAWDDGFTRMQERGTFMHEFGHNLALRHGGGDNVNNKPGYISVMSYLYQLVGIPPSGSLDYSRGAPFDDWANLRFDGGAVGDKGDELLATTSEDEKLDPASAKQLNAFSVPGDGTVAAIGPTMLISNTGLQPITFKVSNISDAPAVFTIDFQSDLPGFKNAKTVSLSGQENQTVTVLLDTTALSYGTYNVSVRLSSDQAGPDIFTTNFSIVVPDLTDATVRAQAKVVSDQLQVSPPADLDPKIKDQIVSMLKSKCGVGDSVSALPPIAVPVPSRVVAEKLTPVSHPASTPIPVSIPAGTYSVQVGSADDAHPMQEDQPNERWYAQFYDSDGNLAGTTASTPDLPLTDTEKTWDGGTVVLSANATSVVYRHVGGSAGPDSIYPSQLKLTANGQYPPQPPCAPSGVKPVSPPIVAPSAPPVAVVASPQIKGPPVPAGDPTPSPSRTAEVKPVAVASAAAVAAPTTLVLVSTNPPAPQQTVTSVSLVAPSSGAEVEVKGIQIENAPTAIVSADLGAQVAFTGFQSSILVVAGMCMIVLGFVTLKTPRRRRR
jgi:hypothetical protein